MMKTTSQPPRIAVFNKILTHLLVPLDERRSYYHGNGSIKNRWLEVFGSIPYPRIVTTWRFSSGLATKKLVSCTKFWSLESCEEGLGPSYRGITTCIDFPFAWNFDWSQVKLWKHFLATKGVMKMKNTTVTSTRVGIRTLSKGRIPSKGVSWPDLNTANMLKSRQKPLLSIGDVR